RQARAVFPPRPPGDRLDQLADAVHDEGGLRAVLAAPARSHHRYRDDRLLLLQSGPGHGPGRFSGAAPSPVAKRRSREIDWAVDRSFPKAAWAPRGCRRRRIEFAPLTNWPPCRNTTSIYFTLHLCRICDCKFVVMKFHGTLSRW